MDKITIRFVILVSEIIMGLDKDMRRVFTKQVNTLLATGLGSILRALGLGKKARMSPVERERRSYTENVRRELLALKEKGISIPVFTL